MMRLPALVAIGLMLTAVSAARAQVEPPRTLATAPSLNYFGLPGLIDTPTAAAMPDGVLGLTLGHFSDQSRITLAFQVLPRVTATLRYAIVGGGFTLGGSQPDQDYYYDRSFDIHWRAIDEGGWWPAVAIGIRDIVGTGLYGSEYIVATRHFGARDQLAVTAGVGWGRLVQRDPAGQPFGTRPPIDSGQGGSVDFDQFFRGDAAVFGGLEWQATDRLRLQVEYSSDLYLEEQADGLLSIDSPFNIGATYRAGRNGTLALHYLYGNTIGLSYSLVLDPNRPAANTLVVAAPNPVAPRTARREAYSTGWTAQPDGPVILRDNVARLMQEDGLELVGLSLDAHRAVLRIRNTGFQFESMALGRALRILSITMPHSVELFEVVFVVEGMDVSRVRIARGDVEALEHAPDGADEVFARAGIEDARRVRDPGLIEIAEPGERLSWGLAPYVETVLFDPSAPVRGDLGLRAEARYAFGSGFVAEGEIRVRMLGNLDESQQVDGPVNSPTAPYPVRTDAYLYNRESDARIERLTFSHYGRPGPNLYSRMTLGYLERMYAGLSTELLWRPVDSRLGIGLEVNHVWQRDFDGGFGLRDYSVTMGHLSAYYDLGEDYRAQLDIGRYLAGDLGATLSLERVFDNGWRVGAFATLTDVSFEDFGEGSFDKGITLEIPVGSIAGQATRRTLGTTLRPLLRDGGATLNVEGRLNALVSDYHGTRLEDTRGMVWR
ncbi:YjbH domain-containing protein [Rhodobacterales bacterium HKCCSP123]|nr:YjbH domain-containing protein [Rhodobacterales bacterium HKCCSP123]